MITVIVAALTSVGTTAATYWLLHKLAPTQTQAVLTAAVTAAKADVTTEATAVEADVAAKV